MVLRALRRSVREVKDLPPWRRWPQRIVFSLARGNPLLGPNLRREAPTSVRADRSLKVRVLADGRLELFSPRTGVHHHCGPTGTTMWIALQQHGWEPARAAAALAPHLGMPAEDIRADVEAWVREFHAAGLVTVVRR
ncbi:PqqD family peptide modification chaperone [Streptomyces sp. NPDC001407]|uniref:PqqD family peptide modification chaperone n=1 Tax=unclassified Streptomyces TaxID=2593676 RepID=UPI0033FBEDD4